MSDLNISPAGSPTPGSNSELTELREGYAELSRQTHNLRIAVLIVSTAVLSFFFLEARRNGQALEGLRPQAAQVAEANKVQDPIATRFLGQLADYSKTHPDFAQILAKYGVRATNAPAPSATAPGALPKK